MAVVSFMRLMVLAAVFSPALPASAVMPSVDGKGQVLIYPYYTVRSPTSASAPFNTLVSIVNSTLVGKVVKLRVHEGRAGGTVFEANLFLSSKDVWTGAIVPAEPGTGLISRDASCTQPGLAPDVQGRPTAAGRFSSAGYATDPLGPGLDRVDEGFIEVIEMGTVPRGTTLATAISHVAGVAPCGLGSDASILADLSPPIGGLYGSATLVSVNDGTAYGYDAVALDQWSSVVAFGGAGSGVPTLAQANPATSSVVDGTKVYTSTWPTGLDAINAALIASSGEAEFMTEAAVNGATDVATTFPTRHLSVDTARAIAPFTAKLSADGACEPVSALLYSREEQLYQLTPRDSIPEAPTPHASLCWSTTVWPVNITHGPSGVLGSTALLRFFVQSSELFPAPAPFSAGIAYLGTSSQLATQTLRAPTTVHDLHTGTTSAPTDFVYAGLPTVGVAFTRYVNGTLDIGGTRTLSNYGANATVRTARSIAAP